MGSTTLDGLPAVLDKYRSQIFATVTRIAQRAALAGGDYLARETPVETGEARSNWVGTIEAPFTGTIPAYVPYPEYRQNHHEAVKSLNLGGLKNGVRVLKGKV